MDIYPAFLRLTNLLISPACILLNDNKPCDLYVDEAFICDGADEATHRTLLMDISLVLLVYYV